MSENVHEQASRADGPVALRIRRMIPRAPSEAGTDPAACLMELARAIDQLAEEFRTHGHCFISGHRHGTLADYGKVASVSVDDMPTKNERWRRECDCPVGEYHADDCTWARYRFNELALKLFGRILG